MESVEGRVISKKRGIGIAFMITLVVLILVLIGFIYYYVQASSSINDYKTTISDQSTKISDLNDQTLSLKKQLDTASTQISSMQSQVSLLETDLSTANSQKSSLQTQVNSLQSEIATLKNQSSSANAQIIDLQSQISSLKAENSDLKSITSLSKSVVVANALTLNIAVDQHVVVTSFTAGYAGYIVVSGTTSNAGIIRVYDSFSGYPLSGYPWGFSSGSTLLIPILPGDIIVKFSYPNNLAGTATLSVTYYY